MLERLSRNCPILLLLALLGSWAALPMGCGSEPADDDDDDSTVADDDDDSTPPVEPLADIIGVFNLTNVVQSESSSYIDFSGAFGSFAGIETETLSPAAYLGTFNYSADAPYWRHDLGGFPIPAEGESVIVNLFEYFPWAPAEQQWWDGGPRIGLGNFLTSRLDLEDVSAYQVDDPLSPGAAAWYSGGTLDWQNPGGADVVAAIFEHGVALPFAANLLQPSPGATGTHPAAHDLQVTWAPALDGASVSVALLRNNELAYIASVTDSGSHTIPGAVLHDEFGPGPVEIILSRTLGNQLEHPQGQVLVRAREERRATLDLLPDVVLAPAWGEPGQTVNAVLHWYTGGLDASTTVEIGQINSEGGIDPDGVTVAALVPDPNDSSRADLQIQVGFGTTTGPRDIRISTDGSSTTLPAGFAVLDLMPSDDCGSATAMTALLPGSYTSSTAGLQNSLAAGFSCLPWSLNGSDAVYRIHLEAGDTLVASMLQPEPADGALVLLSACADPASAVACADGTFSGEEEVLSHTAASSGEYFLVVDSYVSSVNGASSSPFTLELVITSHPLQPGWIVPGESRSFTLTGESPWSSSLAASDIDLGSGITSQSVAPGSSPETVTIQATAAAGAALGSRDISVNNGGATSLEFPEALWVTGWPVYDNCAAASAAAPVAPGLSTGYAVQTSSSINAVSCLPWASPGPEVLLPLDLSAGSPIDITVTSAEDTQLYILSDCNLPESCIAEAAVDDGIEGDVEFISGWTPETSGRYYLVIDLYANPADPLSAWAYDLELSVQ